MAESKNTKKKKKNSLSHILGGGFLTEDFVIKQSKLLILIVFLIIIFISNRYSCMKKLTEIENLKIKLEDVKYENLIISTELTSNSRQSQIEEMLAAKGLGLKSSKASIYKIRK
jgi:hypothetical protein